MKLWEKNIKTQDAVMKFTIGNDPAYDRLLAPYDIIASMAHAIMLGKSGMLPDKEARALVKELSAYYPEVCKESFSLDPDDEDIHSHLEKHLVETVGEAGKKIHTARSRNDQVMVAMQLMMKEEWRLIIEDVQRLFNVMLAQAEKYSEVLIPGYTHTQVAMPSSIAIWLGAYAEALVSDLKLCGGIIKVIDQNALGSAAGFGSSFPIDRDFTTSLAGFTDVLVSPVSAQLNRGKMESTMAFGLGSIAMSLSRLAADMIYYMGQDLNFISFPDELTTGSSIMPHKKNPDVLELIRAHCNTVIQMPSMLNGLLTNLISGYHRDFQLTKEILIPGIEKIRHSLAMMELMLTNMSPREGILKEEKYTFIFSVEEVNRKVMDGKSFRDAYREVAEEIEQGTYSPARKNNYTHLGSIGNPGLERIKQKMEATLENIQIKAIDDIFLELKAYYK